QRIDGLDHKLDQRIAGVDQKIAGLDQKFDQKFATLDQKIDGVENRLTVRMDALRTETVSLKAELVAEIRRVDARIDSVDRELRTGSDLRAPPAAAEAPRLPGRLARPPRHGDPAAYPWGPCGFASASRGRSNGWDLTRSFARWPGDGAWPLRLAHR